MFIEIETKTGTIEIWNIKGNKIVLNFNYNWIRSEMKTELKHQKSMELNQNRNKIQIEQELCGIKPELHWNKLKRLIRNEVKFN